MTNEDLIDLANEAGLCYPRCWDLLDSDEDRMQHLRRFAELILQYSENHD